MALHPDERGLLQRIPKPGRGTPSEKCRTSHQPTSPGAMERCVTPAPASRPTRGKASPRPRSSLPQRPQLSGASNSKHVEFEEHRIRGTSNSRRTEFRGKSSDGRPARRPALSDQDIAGQDTSRPILRPHAAEAHTGCRTQTQEAVSVRALARASPCVSRSVTGTGPPVAQSISSMV